MIYEDEQFKFVTQIPEIRPDIYEISNLGRVRRGNKFLKPQFYARTRCYMVTLCDEGRQKQCSIHRLVALHFIPNPENKPCVNHIDGVRTNSYESNLEWVTYSENAYHAVRTGLQPILRGEEARYRKLTNAQVQEIRQSPLKQKPLAVQYGVDQSTISLIKTRKIWGHI